MKRSLYYSCNFSVILKLFQNSYNTCIHYTYIVLTYKTQNATRFRFHDIVRKHPATADIVGNCILF